MRPQRPVEHRERVHGQRLLPGSAGSPAHSPHRCRSAAGIATDRRASIVTIPPSRRARTPHGYCSQSHPREFSCSADLTRARAYGCGATCAKGLCPRGTRARVAVTWSFTRPSAFGTYIHRSDTWDGVRGPSAPAVIGAVVVAAKFVRSPRSPRSSRRLTSGRGPRWGRPLTRLCWPTGDRL
jgi:hypothetical protein